MNHETVYVRTYVPQGPIESPDLRLPVPSRSFSAGPMGGAPGTETVRPATQSKLTLRSPRAGTGRSISLLKSCYARLIVEMGYLYPDRRFAWQ